MIKKSIEFEARFYSGDYILKDVKHWTYLYTTRRGLKRVWRNAQKRMERVWWSHYDGNGYCEISVKQPDDISHKPIDKTTPSLVS